MRAPDRTRTAVAGALFSAGMAAFMVAAAAVHGPAPAPAPALVPVPPAVADGQPAAEPR